MNDLIRPALYHAYHPFQPETAPDAAPESGWTPADLVGPVCESTDQFAAARATAAALAPGDMLVIGAAGAYGAVMSLRSTMAVRACTGSAGARFEDWATWCAAARTYEEMLAAHSVPDWLES